MGEATEEGEMTDPPIPKSYRNAKDRERRLSYSRSQTAHRREVYPDSIPKVSKKKLEQLRKAPGSAVWRNKVVCLALAVRCLEGFPAEHVRSARLLLKDRHFTNLAKKYWK